VILDPLEMQRNNHTLQHVNVKFFLLEGENVDQGEVLNLFHEWIQENKLDDLLIDVADYRHVPEGPGVILVAHNAFYSLDNAQGRLGLLFNRRTPVDGDAQQVLTQALEAARNFARLMAGEERFEGKVILDRKSLQIVVNDRHFAQNTDETFAALLPDTEAALNQTLGERSYTFKRTPDRRARFTVEVTSDTEFDL
jgi:hypothetical protein